MVDKEFAEHVSVVHDIVVVAALKRDISTMLHTNDALQVSRADALRWRWIGMRFLRRENIGVIGVLRAFRDRM